MILKNNSNFANFTNLSQYFTSYIAEHFSQAKESTLAEEKCKINILPSLDHPFLYNPASVCSLLRAKESNLSFTCRSLVSLGYQLSLFQLSSIYSQLQQLSLYLSNIGIKTTYHLSKILLDWNFNLKYYLNTDFTLDSRDTRLQLFNEYQQQIRVIFNPFVQKLSEIDKLGGQIRAFTSASIFLNKGHIYQQQKEKSIKSTDYPQFPTQINNQLCTYQKSSYQGSLNCREDSLLLKKTSLLDIDSISMQTSPQISFYLSSSTGSQTKSKDRQFLIYSTLVDNMKQSQLSKQNFDEREEVSEVETEDSNKIAKSLSKAASRSQNPCAFQLQNQIFYSIASEKSGRKKQERVRQVNQVIQQEAKQCIEKAKIAVKNSRAFLTTK